MSGTEKRDPVNDLEQSESKAVDQEEKLKRIISGNPMIYTHLNKS